MSEKARRRYEENKDEGSKTVADQQIAKEKNTSTKNDEPKLSTTSDKEC